VHFTLNFPSHVFPSSCGRLCDKLIASGTFQYKPRKRGPPNQYLRKIQESEPPRPDTAGSSGTKDHELTPTWSPSDVLRSDRTSPGQGSHAMSAMERARAHEWEAGLFVGARSEAPNEQPSAGPSSTFGDSSGFTPSIRVSDSRPESHSQSPMYPRSFDYPSSGSQSFNRRSPNVLISPVTSSISPFVYSHNIHNPLNPFDQVLPRGLLYLIIDLYFDYIYGLCPFVHRPTFMRDLHSRKEEGPDGEEWTAFTMAVISSTLLQMPRAFVPLPRSEVKALIIKTFAHVTDYLAKPYVAVTLQRSELDMI
jgi:hypothetical protein